MRERVAEPPRVLVLPVQLRVAARTLAARAGAQLTRALTRALRYARWVICHARGHRPLRPVPAPPIRWVDGPAAPIIARCAFCGARHVATPWLDTVWVR